MHHDAAVLLARLDHFYSSKIMYAVGKGQMRISSVALLWRKLMLHAFSWIGDDTRVKVAALQLAVN